MFNFPFFSETKKKQKMCDISTYPFNPDNSLLQLDTLVAILKNHGIDTKPKDVSIYRKSFLHRSYCTRKNDNFVSGNQVCPADCLPLQEESNERLEFLGDSILNFVVAEYLYERYPTMNEGFLTIMRTRLVNGNMLAHLSAKLELGKLLIISKQIEASKGRENKNLLEDAFEALLGAIYLDFNEYRMNTNGKIGVIDSTGIGFQIVKTFIINVIETYVDFSELIRKKNNPKDTLIKQCQHSFQWAPKFFEIDVQEKNQKKVHTVCIKNDSDTIIATASSDSRKKAELAASQRALIYFGWDS